ncbi:acetyl-CoA synthetase [Mycolicibacterium sp. BK556]|uniref:AMP-binding protein n=1 Tax=unclassified Mycolicibacterium TaxID=2636767 RepID=UPI001617A953|nr:MULTISPECIES: AMP-binding protein [unclassified Mycolicibacterium]MBB3605996.1 acetyl-CoA synthetase [Mycolicibacterium sp. BK556]MBB3632573.1 acetyl-CoA synthetase [Mycolicibacterium sp. BK607]
MSDYEWLPSTDYVENANVTRLARAHGVADIDELRARSVAHPAWYWDAVVEDLAITFAVPDTVLLDLSNGIEHPDWFVGAELNVVDACLTRWRDDDPHRVAVRHEAENGAVTVLTFGELADEVARAAAGLRRIGIQRGDAVALYLPMIPEAVVAVYAVAALGAVLVPLFSGFAASAITSRLADADVKAVVVADATVRRGREVPMLPQLAAALQDCPGVAHLVVIDNVGTAVDPAVDATVTRWAELTGQPADLVTEIVPAMHPLLLGYTSGTTGRPKGAVHTHAGFLVKTASEVAYSFDMNRDGVFCWITDMGWIMGPLSIIGTHANGAALVLFEGSPDVPDDYRLWDLVARHKISMLGVSPTLIRTLKGSDLAQIHTRDLSSVHVLGSTGEPWDPDSYDWLGRDVFGGRVPIINFSGGTEVGGSFLAPYPVEPIRSCSLGGPSLGMDVDVVDNDGRSIRGQVGELVCRQPWPSMTRSVWKDDQRYLDAYWSRFPGMWTHGDFAMVGEDGQWFILGRSDDVMNVAGKRLAPAEVESALSNHPAVGETAAVGIPDPVKGEAVWAFWVARPGSDPDESTVAAELKALVGAQLGKPFAPSKVWRVDALPKTRSAKIMRRAIRAAALGTDPGDLSGAENPEAVNAIREVVSAAQSSTVMESR